MSLDAHFNAILAKRVDKSWTPVFWSSAAFAALHPTISGYTVQVDESVLPHTIELRSSTGVLMARYSEASPQAGTFEAARYPERFYYDFSDGIGHWGSSGVSSVAGGIFTSHTWSYDTNHLIADGGAGMLHLLAYANNQYWEYQKPDLRWIGSDLTRARIVLRARGVSYNPNGSIFIPWVQARHPTAPGKFVNWGYVGEPRTAQLTSGNWEDISWRLDPDPAQWVWGKGVNLGTYDTFLSLRETLQNVHNVHFVMLGPDNVGHPSGTFELDSFEIIFNRNGPGPQ